MRPTTVTRKREVSFAIMLVLAATPALSQQSSTTSVKVIETRLLSGHSVPAHQKRITGSEGEFQIEYVIIDPRAKNIRLALPKNPESGGSSLWDFFRDEHADAVVTGGYLSAFSPATPQGLLRFNFKVINDPLPSDPVLTGVICFGQSRNDSPILIARYVHQQLFEQWSSCIQSGPLLLKDGKFHDDLQKLEDELAGRMTDASRERKSGFTKGTYERAFVLQTRASEIVLGVTTPTSLYSLRAALALPDAENGFNASDAILLSGWRTAGLIVNGERQIFFGYPSTLLPNAIVANSK